jgi:PPK2 family polyphosphate:nucleotide phosphotransferase
MNFQKHTFNGHSEFKLQNHSTKPDLKITSKEANPIITENALWLDNYQEKLFASGKYAVLVVFQAMDAAGKDGTIRKLLTGVNPQGIRVTSFKRPTPEEVAHDFLWRVQKALPEKGIIGVFNRSHYEEVLVTKVHPEFIAAQNLPNVTVADNTINLPDDFWEQRYEAIRNFEKHLAQTGTIIIKFFLHVSKDEQKERLIDRMSKPEKHWKFNITDFKERKHWSDYMKAYEKAIQETGTDYAPWYIIPADDKDNMRVLVSSIVKEVLEQYPVDYPDAAKEIEQDILTAQSLLKEED